VSKRVNHVAVLGTGTIGASWAAYFLAQGLSVAASDPAPGAEAFLQRFVDDAWPTLEQLGLTPGADRGRLRFEADPVAAVEGADFVQENGPERIDIKVALFGPDAAEVASDDNGGEGTDSLLSVRVPVDGTYTVWVSAAAGGGQYSLQLIEAR